MQSSASAIQLNGNVFLKANQFENNFVHALLYQRIANSFGSRPGLTYWSGSTVCKFKLSADDKCGGEHERCQAVLLQCNIREVNLIHCRLSCLRDVPPLTIFLASYLLIALQAVRPNKFYIRLDSAWHKDLPQLEVQVSFSASVHLSFCLQFFYLECVSLQ